MVDELRGPAQSLTTAVPAGRTRQYAKLGPIFDYLLMRNVLKCCAEVLAMLAVLPAFVLYRLESIGLGEGKVFPGWSQLFSLIPGLYGIYLRRAVYRLVFRPV